MRDWVTIDSAEVPDDDGTVFLVRRGREYVIHVDGRQLMTNTVHGSEDALAQLACERLVDRTNARILVGGLGMGFTLAAALAEVGPDGLVTVAELLQSVVTWNREHTGRAAGHPLRDERCRVYVGDVADLVEKPPEPWSAILLDVDNGPRLLTRPVNGWLYTRQGLRDTFASLAPGGVLAVWSAHPDASFTRRLEKAGFDVEVVPYTEPGRESRDGRSTDTIWIARRPIPAG